MKGAPPRSLAAAVLLAAGTMLLPGCAGTPDRGPGERAAEDRRSRIYLDLGVAYLRQGEPRKALRKLQRAESLNRDDARIHNAKALAYQQLGFDDRAREAFRVAIERDPEDPQVRNNFGVFLARKGDREEARAQFRKALGSPLYSTPEKAYYNLGWLARRAGESEEAEGMLRTALRLRPRYPAARLALARLLRDQGQVEEARQRLKPLLERRPESVQGHLLAGELARERGDNESARQHLRRATDLAPDSRAADRARRILQHLPVPEEDQDPESKGGKEKE